MLLNLQQLQKELLINYLGAVIASAMYMDVQVPWKAGEGETGKQSRGWPGRHAGNGQRGSPGRWN